MTNSALCFHLLILLNGLWFSLIAAQNGNSPQSLALDFYQITCPRAHDIIKAEVIKVVNQNPSQAAGLMRIVFHDCFVQGCDASLLLTKPMVSEQIATPNNASLRQSTIRILDHIKDQVEAACPGVVSCADTIVLSAAIALELVGGPNIPVLMGRRDSQTAASNQTVIANIPSPQLSISGLKQNFQNHGLDTKDLVALSGAHTFGQAHCRVVDLQLTPTVSSDLNASFAANLARICQPNNSAQNRGGFTVHLNFLSTDVFDNSYYKNVLNKVAIFHSDAELLNASDTKQLVQLYASDQATFFQQFKLSFTKMAQMGVVTGQNGVIRKKCSVPNS
ncbi:hypothetical protein KP509_10G011800 [Ceratopteris richardii]|uniref:Peroxidase n=1 Tax=Ceratopteris richardii TaxID=49495 RepID=A0A8T2TYN1_CERRI|nr:hypothetical protein KP509_10G011800 [Ceratopteris richardii]